MNYYIILIAPRLNALMVLNRFLFQFENVYLMFSVVAVGYLVQAWSAMRGPLLSNSREKNLFHVSIESQHTMPVQNAKYCGLGQLSFGCHH